jgi:hypothetical protein
MCPTLQWSGRSRPPGTRTVWIEAGDSDRRKIEIDRAWKLLQYLHGWAEIAGCDVESGPRPPVFFEVRILKGLAKEIA